MKNLIKSSELGGLISHGKTNDAIELINAGNHDLNYADLNSVTPLMKSVQHSNMEVFLLLLANGVELDTQDKYKNLALFLSIKLDYQFAIKLIEHGARTDFINSDKHSMLNMAIKDGNLPILKALCYSCKILDDVDKMRSQLEEQHNYVSVHNSYNGGYELEDNAYKMLDKIEFNLKLHNQLQDLPTRKTKKI